MSTLLPWWVTNLTPFWWISRLPIVFLPTRFGLIHRFSSCSLRADFRGTKASNSFSPWRALTSASVSCVFNCFKHSFICLQATERRLLELEDFVFIVSSRTQIALSSGSAGYCIDAEGPTWKFILKKVHWPCWVSLQDLIVDMWKGIKEVGPFGIKTAFLFVSTHICPGCRSFGN